MAIIEYKTTLPGDTPVDATHGLPVSGVTQSNGTSAGLAASVIVKASAGTLHKFTVYNSNAAAQYIQLHNSATLPANAAVPLMTFVIAAHAHLTVDYGVAGRAFTNGIVLCNSSTEATKTLGAADCLFDAQYDT